MPRNCPLDSKRIRWQGTPASARPTGAGFAQESASGSWTGPTPVDRARARKSPRYRASRAHHGGSDTHTPTTSEMTMPNTTTVPPGAIPRAAVRRAAPSPVDRSDIPTLRVVPWVDPVADPHGLHPCSRYVELYWLPIIGPSTTWLLRRLPYGLEVHGDGFDLHLPETARSLGLGDKMGKNSPFRRALARLITFELARPQGPAERLSLIHI